MWSVQGKSDLGAWFGLGLFLTWLLFLFSFVRFDRWVAPRAAARWAADHGYRLIRLDRVYGSPWFGAPSLIRKPARPALCQALYDLLVSTPEGTYAEGWLIVGGCLWPCQSASRCPVQVQWS